MRLHCSRDLQFEILVVVVNTNNKMCVRGKGAGFLYDDRRKKRCPGGYW